MPIPPAPIRYTCPNCGWSKTVTPKSDVLFAGEFFRACPRCHHTPLDTRQLSTSSIQHLIQQIKSVLR